MNTPMVSIIIATYNSEKYLDNAINSILTEPLVEYEIVIIDDGSTDNSQAIIQKHAENNDRIQCFKIPNGGPAGARNVGISKAKGKYLLFVDSDDVIEMDGLKHALETAESNSSDLVITGFRIISEALNKDIEYKYRDMVICSAEELKSIISDLYIKNFINPNWNKLYRRELIVKNNITFPDYRYGEDRLFAIQVIKETFNISIISNCMYKYYLHDKPSLVNQFYNKKYQVCCLIDEKMRDLLVKYNINTRKDIENLDFMFTKSLISCLTNISQVSCPYSIKKKNREIKKILESKWAKERMHVNKVNGFTMNVIIMILKTRIAWINHLVAYGINQISAITPQIFIVMKNSKRNKHEDI